MLGTKARTGREFWLSRHLALVSAVALAVVGGTLGHIYRSTAVDYVERMATLNNLVLTRAFANSLWPRFSSFVRSDHQLTAEELRSHPQTGELRRAVARLMSGTRVVKVKVYDLNGLTVFSTDLRQLGESKRTNRGFLAARNGRVESDFTRRDHSDSFEATHERRDVLSSHIPIYGASGGIEGVLEIHSDVTDLREQAIWHKISEKVAANRFVLFLMFVFLLFVVYRAERVINRQRRENRKLAATAAQAEAASDSKSQFLANLGHELRTPLNAIIGFSEIMRDDVLGPVNNPRYRRYAADIHFSGQRLLGVINDLLDLEKVESGAFELSEHEIEVGATVAASLRRIKDDADSRGLTLGAEIPGDLPLLRGDPGLVKQMLLNLLANAVKFTPERGEVTVKAGTDAAGALWIAVTDTGIGIPEDQVAKAMEPFGQVDNASRRKYEGTGLGLALVKRFIEMHDGTLELQSEVDVGTTVAVRFPPERVIREKSVPRKSAVMAGAQGRRLQISAKPDHLTAQTALRSLPGAGRP